jgi:ribosome-associated protein
MTKTKTDDSQSLTDAVVKGIQEVKGQEICTIDLRNLPNAVCDFFVICHGTSDTHVDAIARSVERMAHQRTGQEPSHTEGASRAEWILMDYFDVVVHIFREPARRFYNLEKLWADADVKEIDHQLQD